MVAAAAGSRAAAEDDGEEEVQSVATASPHQSSGDCVDDCDGTAVADYSPLTSDAADCQSAATDVSRTSSRVVRRRGLKGAPHSSNRHAKIHPTAAKTTKGDAADTAASERVALGIIVKARHGGRQSPDGKSLQQDKLRLSGVERALVKRFVSAPLCLPLQLTRSLVCLMRQQPFLQVAGACSAVAESVPYETRHGLLVKSSRWESVESSSFSSQHFIVSSNQCETVSRHLIVMFCAVLIYFVNKLTILPFSGQMEPNAQSPPLARPGRRPRQPSGA